MIERRTGVLPIFGLILIVFLAAACSEENGQEDPSSGKLLLRFEHLIDGEPAVFDTLMYENTAGNPFLVNEIQYFISDVILYKDDGSIKLIDDWKAIHYVDTDIESTHTWEVYDPIDPGVYDSLAFTFGISPERNMSYMFVNPPEKDMFWPEYLGGGYHYLKLNGKWLPEGQSFQTAPFDFHLGIGQIYYSYPDSITGFVHNNFNVSLPGSGFQVDAGVTTELVISMRIDQWFEDPNVYDHDVFGGYIMQNQEAMQKVKENGHNVFMLREDAHD
jgi:hypothetical protein